MTDHDPPSAGFGFDADEDGLPLLAVFVTTRGTIIVPMPPLDLLEAAEHERAERRWLELLMLAPDLLRGAAQRVEERAALMLAADDILKKAAADLQERG